MHTCPAGAGVSPAGEVVQKMRRLRRRRKKKGRA
jgi:hypothetical protein